LITQIDIRLNVPHEFGDRPDADVRKQLTKAIWFPDHASRGQRYTAQMRYSFPKINHLPGPRVRVFDEERNVVPNSSTGKFLAWCRLTGLGLLLLGAMRLLAADTLQVDASKAVELFLAAPDYKTSEGTMIVRNNQPDWPTNAVDRLVWSNGDFLEEVLLNSSVESTQDESPTRNGTILYAEGRDHGTNWSYRDAILTYQGAFSKNAELLKSRLGGLTPEEHFLSTILGRGFTLAELSTLKPSPSGSMLGKYGGTIPIVVTLSGLTDGCYEASFLLKLTNRTNSYVRRFSLLPFGNATYVPRELAAYALIRGTNRTELNTTTIFATNSTLGQPLSPWLRYPVMSQRLREGTKVYALDPVTHNRQLISSRNDKVGFPGWKRWAVPAFAFLMLMIPVAIYYKVLRKTPDRR
jgi:hypothetical protein